MHARLFRSYISMNNKSWTWIERYGTWFRPKIPRLCEICGYKGYFRLKESIVFVPNHPPFIEICPKCGNQIELKKGDNPKVLYTPTKEIEKLAEFYSLTIDELIDEAFKKLIMEFDPKTGKFRLIHKDTGKEISFDKKRP